MTKTRPQGTGQYQIYVEANGQWSDDGCWGSENAHFGAEANSEADAISTCEFLAREYPDADWAVADPDGRIVHEIEASRVDPFDE